LSAEVVAQVQFARGSLPTGTRAAASERLTIALARVIGGIGTRARPGLRLVTLTGVAARAGIRSGALTVLLLLLLHAFEDTEVVLGGLKVRLANLHGHQPGVGDVVTPRSGQVVVQAHV